ncbi:hypothetical protein E1176_02255, partial [Fulvivirga sp. RKSG066]|uniref:hypothetical protein n=1 Tax=Fulvivirga aurantia TaxID=2529383 RepID=UPI0012BCBF55
MKNYKYYYSLSMATYILLFATFFLISCEDEEFELPLYCEQSETATFYVENDDSNHIMYARLESEVTADIALFLSPGEFKEIRVRSAIYEIDIYFRKENTYHPVAGRVLNMEPCQSEEL